MIRPYTLHIRLTHACNASCTYCSSWKKSAQPAMSPEDLSSSLDYVESLWLLKGISPSFLNIEYVGGEILLISPEDLEKMVYQTRERFESKGICVRDGAQSNLIGSERRIKHLYDLFDGRVGTSIDRYSGQRILGKAPGGAERYRTFQIHVEKNDPVVSRRTPPAVLALDNKTLPFLMQELKEAVKESRDITLRPIFQGGSGIERVDPLQMGQALVDAFNWWFRQAMPIHLEPFVSLLSRRFDEQKITDNGFCAWQADCSEKSLSIEPNGDLYICQELADMDGLRLGNALAKSFDEAQFDNIRLRQERLDRGCFTCTYYKSCQGGCMQQSIEGGNGLYGKTQWCASWKMLFAAIDQAISQSTPERLKRRLNTILDI